MAKLKFRHSLPATANPSLRASRRCQPTKRLSVTTVRPPNTIGISAEVHVGRAPRRTEAIHAPIGSTSGGSGDASRASVTSTTSGKAVPPKGLEPLTVGLEGRPSPCGQLRSTTVLSGHECLEYGRSRPFAGWFGGHSPISSPTATRKKLGTGPPPPNDQLSSSPFGPSVPQKRSEVIRAGSS